MPAEPTSSVTAQSSGLQIPCLYSAEQIALRVDDLAKEISADYAGTQLLVVGVLQGAWIFMADLVRQMPLPVRCGFVMLSSYGNRMVTTGEVKLKLDVTQPVNAEHVLIVDDIVDTGISVNWLIEHLKRRDPASVRVCALLDKPARRRVEVKIDYLGFEIEDRFIVGYGIDWVGRYRDLPYVGYVPDDA